MVARPRMIEARMLYLVARVEFCLENESLER